MTKPRLLIKEEDGEKKTLGGIRDIVFLKATQRSSTLALSESP